MSPEICGNTKTKMPGRNGSTIRLVGAAFSILVIVYLIYSNQNVNTKLRDTELLIERYKRSQSSLSVQLKDLLAAKADQETRHANDKEAMHGRFSALTRDFKLLQDKKEELTQQNVQQTADCDRAKDEINGQMSQERQKHEAFKNSQQAALSDKQESIDNLNRENHKYISQLSECQAANKKLQTEKETLVENLHLVNAELEALKSHQTTSGEKRRFAAISKTFGISLKNAKLKTFGAMKPAQGVGRQEENGDHVVDEKVDRTTAKPFVSHDDLGIKADTQRKIDALLQNQPLEEARKDADARGKDGDEKQMDAGLFKRDGNEKHMDADAYKKDVNQEQNDDQDKQISDKALKYKKKVEDKINFEAQQIRPPDHGDAKPGYKKQDKIDAVPGVDAVAGAAKEQFAKEQQENAQLQMPKVRNRVREYEEDEDERDENDDENMDRKPHHLLEPQDHQHREDAENADRRIHKET